jgi:hypothetical protein
MLVFSIAVVLLPEEVAIRIAWCRTSRIGENRESNVQEETTEIGGL